MPMKIHLQLSDKMLNCKTLFHIDIMDTGRWHMHNARSVNSESFQDINGLYVSDYSYPQHYRNSEWVTQHWATVIPPFKK